MKIDLLFFDATFLTDNSAERQRRSETSDEHEHQTNETVQTESIQEIRFVMIVTASHLSENAAKNKTTSLKRIFFVFLSI